jgi:hypothetical protein
MDTMGENISPKFEELLETWGVEKEKVSAIVTDHGTNMLKAARDTSGVEKQLESFAHNLNLVVKAMLEKMESEIEEVIILELSAILIQKNARLPIFYYPHFITITVVVSWYPFI